MAVAPAYVLLPAQSTPGALIVPEAPERAFSAEGACAQPPLTSEPPLPDAEPLTSEPPLADAAPLTSEAATRGGVGDGTDVCGTRR